MSGHYSIKIRINFKISISCIKKLQKQLYNVAVPGSIHKLLKYTIINHLFLPRNMYLAHSALRTTTKNGKTQLKDNELQLRIEAYRNTCQKYHQEIAAIQKYLPGWMPLFEAKG